MLSQVHQNVKQAREACRDEMRRHGECRSEFFFAEELKDRHGGLARFVRQELRQDGVSTCRAPRLTFTRLHHRFREGNGTRCPEHQRPPAFSSKCSGMSQQCWHLPCWQARAARVCGLVTPATSRLDGDHYESTSPGGDSWPLCPDEPAPTLRRLVGLPRRR